MKPFYKSKTIQLAILMGISGVLTAFLSEYPELKAFGFIFAFKAIIDIYLRFITKYEVK